MRQLLADIARMFAHAEPRADDSGCLSAVLERLRRWAGTTAFLFDDLGQILGIFPPVDAAGAAGPTKLAKQLAQSNPSARPEKL